MESQAEMDLKGHLSKYPLCAWISGLRVCQGQRCRVHRSHTSASHHPHAAAALSCQQHGVPPCRGRGDGDLTWLVGVLQLGHLRCDELGTLLFWAVTLHFFSSWQFLQFFKVILPREKTVSVAASTAHGRSLPWSGLYQGQRCCSCSICTGF